MTDEDPEFAGLVDDELRLEMFSIEGMVRDLRANGNFEVARGYTRRAILLIRAIREARQLRFIDQAIWSALALRDLALQIHFELFERPKAAIELAKAIRGEGLLLSNKRRQTVSDSDIWQAISESRGNLTRASEHLGISTRQIRNRLTAPGPGLAFRKKMFRLLVKAARP